MKPIAFAYTAGVFSGCAMYALGARDLEGAKIFGLTALLIILLAAVFGWRSAPHSGGMNT